MQEYSVSSAAEALKLCRQLAADGSADFFRGQPEDWPLIPSLLRRRGRLKKAALDRLAHFTEWAENVPQMNRYAASPDAIAAIAQHYGVPTRYLDWSTAPEPALFFAQEPGGKESHEGFIYCLSKAELEHVKGARLVQISVRNLWRLKAQKGVFVELASASGAKALASACSRIRFPVAKSPVDRSAEFYPQRKSVLEIAIDEWFYREEIEQALGRMTSNATRVVTLKRNNYPGVFPWRQVPDIPQDWAWAHFQISSKREQQLPQDTTRIAITVEVPSVDEFGECHRSITSQLRDPVRRACTGSSLLNVRVTLPPPADMHADAIGIIAHRCWDGMRPFLYTADEVLHCLALAITVLAGRAAEAAWREDWPTLLYDETEIVEFAPFGGFIGSAVISRSDLHRAFRVDIGTAMAPYFQRVLRERPHEIFRYIVEPWHLFGQNDFRSLFARQVIPSAIDAFWRSDLELNEGRLECLWDIAFDPVHLGYFTPAEYRFRSPLQLEANPQSLILVMQDMTDADVGEAFLFGYPDAALDGRPFTVRFPGYEFDSRELVDVPEVVRQCRTIVDAGGISVLDVVPPGMMGESASADGEPASMTAIHIWLIAQGMLGGDAGRRVEVDREIFDRFWNDLGRSNQVADAGYQMLLARYPR